MKTFFLENQEFIFSGMILILSVFVVILWVMIKKTHKVSSGPSSSDQDVLGKRLKEMTQRMQDAFKKIDKLESQTTESQKYLIKEMEEIKTQLKETSANEARNVKTKNTIDDLNKKITETLDQFKNIIEQINNLQNNAEDIKEELNNIEAKVSKGEMNISQMGANISELGSRISQQDANIAQSCEKDGKNDLIDSSVQKISDLESEVKKQVEQMENWYRVFESIDADMVDINNKIRALSEKKE